MKAKRDVKVLSKTHNLMNFALTHVNDIVDNSGRVIIYFNAARDAWALPGNEFTSNRAVAERIANNVQALHVSHRKQMAKR